MADVTAAEVTRANEVGDPIDETEVLVIFGSTQE